MQTKTEKKKLYFSRSEAAEIIGISVWTLDEWCRRFPFLTRKQIGPTTKKFSQNKINYALKIKKLLRSGYTIEGAKKIVKLSKI